MKSLIFRLSLASCLSLLATSLLGCGQKGPLYLPTNPAPAPAAKPAAQPAKPQGNAPTNPTNLPTSTPSNKAPN